MKKLIILLLAGVMLIVTGFGTYIGARLSGVTAATVTLLVFYCTVPVDEEEE